MTTSSILERLARIEEAVFPAKKGPQPLSMNEHIERSLKTAQGIVFSRVRSNDVFDLPAKDTKRGTGRSTKQMKWAPKDAVFIHTDGAYWYYADLAKKIGRGDLTLIQVSQLPSVSFSVWETYAKKAMVLDHAAADQAPWLRKRVDQHNDNWIRAST
jgi:hypothetical protein